MVVFPFSCCALRTPPCKGGFKGIVITLILKEFKKFNLVLVGVRLPGLQCNT
uniref:Uncharacterized protein n=1 Tax=Aegilops tauschii subsp. strangulata TaxID=200361 RepID=A0A453NED1_AEGTS